MRHCCATNAHRVVCQDISAHVHLSDVSGEFGYNTGKARYTCLGYREACVRFLYKTRQSDNYLSLRKAVSPKNMVRHVIAGVRNVVSLSDGILSVLMFFFASMLNVKGVCVETLMHVLKFTTYQLTSFVWEEGRRREFMEEHAGRKELVLSSLEGAAVKSVFCHLTLAHLIPQTAGS